jgi:hypothetical protein
MSVNYNVHYYFHVLLNKTYFSLGYVHCGPSVVHHDWKVWMTDVNQLCISCTAWQWVDWILRRYICVDIEWKHIFIRIECSVEYMLSINSEKYTSNCSLFINATCNFLLVLQSCSLQSWKFRFRSLLDYAFSCLFCIAHSAPQFQFYLFH